MIVLDEQLLGHGIEVSIAAWYPGAILYINHLRPNTIIKDDAIPMLLGQQVQPVFVTINETDFWRKTAVTAQFSVVCIAVPDSRAKQIPTLLQRLLQHRDFRTKAQRSGHVFRLTNETALYYSATDSTVRGIDGW